MNYYVYDGHGNTVTLTDANGATVSKCDYSAYGNRTSIKSYVNTPFKYCGEYQDNESGMVYLRNRYYKINGGRFTQEDPAKDGLNWYAYCGNNPVNFVDPWGLYFVMSQESYVKLNALAKIVFGSDDFNLAYKTDGDSIIIDKDNWDYDDIDTGSETGKALLKDLICSDSEIKVSFTNSDEKSIYDSSAGIDYIDLINIDIDNANVNMMNEYSTILIHEAAHTYSEIFGAMKAANMFAVNKDFGNIDTKKKHGEAIAITVEER